LQVLLNVLAGIALPVWGTHIGRNRFTSKPAQMKRLPAQTEPVPDIECGIAP